MLNIEKQELEGQQPAGTDKDEEDVDWRLMKSREEWEKENDTAEMTRDSPVYTATRETLFPKSATPERTHALSLEWVTGMNPTVPVVALQDDGQMVLLYAAAHVGVIYNHATNSQYTLEGHYNAISSMCVSEDRRWIATADLKSTVIIWDSYSGIPVQTLFDCHPEGGVIAVAFSGDTKYLATLGSGDVQRVGIWDWTSDVEQPLWFCELGPDDGLQVSIAFNPNDSTQLLTNSEGEVIFYCTAQGSLKCVTLEVNKYFDGSSSEYDEIHHPAAKSSATVKVTDEKQRVTLSQSVFHWKKPQILTGTGGGGVLVWELLEDFAANQTVSRDRLRHIALQKYPITVLTVTDSYIVTGDTRGHINFYDENFLLLTWYDQFNLDPIVSISFSEEFMEGHVEDCTLERREMTIRNFVVSTVAANVVHVNAQKGTSQVLLRENCEPLYAVACHPKQPVVAMGTQSSVLKVWDYGHKVPICHRTFESKTLIRCLTFDPEGLLLAVGFDDGAVHILNTNNFQSEPEGCFHHTAHSITRITFSPDSKYLATADAGKAVTVFHLQTDDVSSQRWKYLGRHQSHYKPIKDLLFGLHPDNQPRLLSLGVDRLLVEYDLHNSKINNLLISSSERIEQSSVPMCMTSYPPVTAEQFLVFASDQYKMKLLTSDTKTCRKTILGPTYGTPVKKIAVLPSSKDRETKYYMAFITEDKLGLQILPLDGNPYTSNALTCHPAGVSDFACSYEGRFVFTAGGPDCTLLSWEMNFDALEAAAGLGGKDMTPFYSLLEGGRDGTFFRELEDFFYYCQIRHQGVNSMETREVSTKIPLSEVPSLMRALAYFPTEKEVEDIQSEVEFSKYAETGKYVNEIDLEEFIKLYVNHRPAFGISTSDLGQAFHILGRCDSTGRPVLQRHDLLEVLQTRGEAMTEDEVAECFSTLLGLREEKERESPVLNINKSHGADPELILENVIPEEISLETFTGHILGFPSPVEESGRSSSMQ